MDAEAIRRKIRPLPLRLRWPTGLRRIVARLGGETRCLVCEGAIGPSEIAYTLTDVAETHVHRECFVIWMEELEAGHRHGTTPPPVPPPKDP